MNTGRDLTALLQPFEAKAAALLAAYTTGTTEALERHYALTWHRREWRTMRTYIQLDLGKRPTSDADDVPITLDDARYLIAMEHQFENWAALCANLSALPDGAVVTATPVTVTLTPGVSHTPLLHSRDWHAVLRTLEANPDAALVSHGQITDAMLAELAQIGTLTSLRLGDCKSLTDAGIAHLARLPGLRHLDLSSTGVTDAGLAVVRSLPVLEHLELVMTNVTDIGMEHLRACEHLRELNLMWTRTGDGAIRAMAGKQKFTHFISGNGVTDAGLAALKELPALLRPRLVSKQLDMVSDEKAENHLSLRGPFTDAGMTHLAHLTGLAGLSIDDSGLRITERALLPLTALPHLTRLSVNATDAWMPAIAALPALKFLGAQDTSATDDGFVALSKSRTIEQIWGRRCHGLRDRGFRALGTMPALRGMSMSCLNVSDSALACFPDFPALRELMPMDVPDASYRHIGKCTELERLVLMYCRDTTDAATEHLMGLHKLTRYFNSYTTITDRTPELLSRLSTLEQVELVACNNVTDAGVAHLTRLPRLRELHVSGNAMTPAVTAAFPPTVRVLYMP
jgi:Leucine-rich repeat (LRR) protein